MPAGVHCSGCACRRIPPLDRPPKLHTHQTLETLGLWKPTQVQKPIFKYIALLLYQHICTTISSVRWPTAIPLVYVGLARIIEPASAKDPPFHDQDERRGSRETKTNTRFVGSPENVRRNLAQVLHVVSVGLVEITTPKIPVWYFQPTGTSRDFEQNAIHSTSLAVEQKRFPKEKKIIGTLDHIT